MSVTFAELAGSPRGQLADGDFVGQRRFLIAWADWPAFLVEIYGGPQVVGASVAMGTPATFPGVPQAIATDVSFAPLDGDDPVKPGEITLTNGSAATYDNAVVRVTYRIPFAGTGHPDRDDLPGVPEGTYLSYSGEVGAEYVSVPGRSWEWTSDDERLEGDIHPGLLLPTEDFTLTWHRVALAPWDAIRDAAGKLNSGTLLNYAAEQVLFVGARRRRRFQLQDVSLWTLDYQFRARRETWNKFYRPGTGWAEIDDGSGNRPFATTSFDALFQYST
mgnify:CR=1 FL=1